MKRILLTLAAMIAASAQALAGAKVGEPASDFRLPDTKGKTHSLADFKGKYVVLEWVNHGCPFVKKHYDGGAMQILQREITGKDAVWLSICSSAPGKQGHMSAEEWNKTIEEKKSVATAVLLDGDGTVGKTYEAKTTPHMFIIDPQGKLVYAGGIDDKPTAKKEDVAGANNYVRAAFSEIALGQGVTKAETKPYGCSVKYADPAH